MWTAQYWKALAEETVQGFSAGALSVLGMEYFNVIETDWKAALGVGLGGAVLVVLKGLALKNVGVPQSPAITK